MSREKKCQERKQLIKEIKKTMSTLEWTANEFLLVLLSEDSLKQILKNRKHN